MKLEVVAYASKCNRNLILFGQLRKSKITYIDNSDVMSLIQEGQAIAHARKD